MKDPLRYFLDEGFGQIFVYRTSDGDYAGEIFFSKLNKGFIPTFSTFEGQRVMGFENIENDRCYIIDREFFEKYGNISDTKEEAVKRVVEYDAEWMEVIKFVAETKDLLA